MWQGNFMDCTGAEKIKEPYYVGQAFRGYISDAQLLPKHDNPRQATIALLGAVSLSSLL